MNQIVYCGDTVIYITTPICTTFMWLCHAPIHVFSLNKWSQNCSGTCSPRSTASWAATHAAGTSLQVSLVVPKGSKGFKSLELTGTQNLIEPAVVENRRIMMNHVRCEWSWEFGSCRSIPSHGAPWPSCKRPWKTSAASGETDGNQNAVYQKDFILTLTLLSPRNRQNVVTCVVPLSS